jgi:hypothetical protein
LGGREVCSSEVRARVCLPTGGLRGPKALGFDLAFNEAEGSCAAAAGEGVLGFLADAQALEKRRGGQPFDAGGFEVLVVRPHRHPESNG